MISIGNNGIQHWLSVIGARQTNIGQLGATQLQSSAGPLTDPPAEFGYAPSAAGCLTIT